MQKAQTSGGHSFVHDIGSVIGQLVGATAFGPTGGAVGTMLGGVGMDMLESTASNIWNELVGDGGSKPTAYT